MTDTIQSIAYLLGTLFPDSIPDDGITPSSLRQAVVSLASRSLTSVAQLGALPSAAGSDNTSNLQAAINAGGAYFVPAGTYNLASFLQPKSNVWLIGESPETTILSSSDSGNSGAVFRHYDGSTVSNFRLSNIGLTTPLTGGDSVGDGLVMLDHSSSDNWVLSNLHFSAPSIGTNGFTAVCGDYGKFCQALTIEDCIFDDVGRMGIELLNQHPTWTANTAYSLNGLVSPTTTSQFDYMVTTAGTSGSTEPAWPTTIGGTVTDGSVTYTCVALQYNIRKHNLLRSTFRNIGGVVGGWAHSFSGRAIDNLIADNIFEGDAGNTILAENAGASFSTYRGNRFIDWTSQTALSVSGALPGFMVGTSYIDNKFRSRGSTGGIRIADSERALFADNIIDMGASLILAGCTNSEFSDNQFTTTSGNSLGMDGGSGNQITGNTIDNTPAGTNVAPVVLFNGASRNVVRDNTFRLAAGGVPGVNESGAGAGNTYFRNLLDNGTDLLAADGFTAVLPNLITDSEDFTAWIGFGTVTVTADQAQGPSGGSSTADNVAITAVSSGVYKSFNYNGPLTFSVWARTISGDASFSFNYFRASDASSHPQAFTATADWQRFTFQFSGDGNPTSNLAVMKDSGQTAPGTIQLWGAMLNAGSFVAPYIPN